jgi:hypothetical protein
MNLRMSCSTQIGFVIALWATLLGFSGCTTSREQSRESDGIRNDDSAIRINLPSAVERLRHGLQSGDINRLVVLQIDRNTVTRMNVSSMGLERNYDYMLDNRRLSGSKAGSDFLDALTRARPSPADQVADLRWGFVFCKDDGTLAFSAYCDAAGKRGVIDGACFTFENGSLAELADALFPPWMK